MPSSFLELAPLTALIASEAAATTFGMVWAGLSLSGFSEIGVPAAAAAAIAAGVIGGVATVIMARRAEAERAQEEG